VFIFRPTREKVVIHCIRGLMQEEIADFRDMRFHHYGWPAFRERSPVTALTEDELRFLQTRLAEDKSAFKYLRAGSMAKNVCLA
jgi:hypothetical protein